MYYRKKGLSFESKNVFSFAEKEIGIAPQSDFKNIDMEKFLLNYF